MYPFSIAQGPKANPGVADVYGRQDGSEIAVDPADFAVPATLKAPIAGGKEVRLNQDRLNSQVSSRKLMRISENECSRMPLCSLLKLTLCAVFALLGAAPVLAQPTYKFDAATVSGLPARNIGSAAMSGRIAAVDAVRKDGA